MTDPRQLSRAFKALSNPNRLQIFLEVMQHRQLNPKDFGGCALTGFINSLNIGAPTVSHHVKELVNADLIRVERNGKFMSCHLNERLCVQLRDFFTTPGDTKD